MVLLDPRALSPSRLQGRRQPWNREGIYWLTHTWMQGWDAVNRSLSPSLTLLFCSQGLFSGGLSLWDSRQALALQSHIKPVSNLSGKRAAFSK